MKLHLSRSTLLRLHKTAHQVICLYGRSSNYAKQYKTPFPKTPEMTPCVEFECAFIAEVIIAHCRKQKTQMNRKMKLKSTHHTPSEITTIKEFAYILPQFFYLYMCIFHTQTHTHTPKSNHMVW